MQPLNTEIKEVIKLWYDASKKDDLDTTKKTSLYERTERLSNEIKIINDRTHYDLVISEIANRNSQENTCLANWIGKNSQHSYQVIEGAYKPWDQLFRCTAKLKHPVCIINVNDYDSPYFDNVSGIEIFLLIDYLAKESLRKMTNEAAGNVPELPNELKKTLVASCPNLTSVSKSYKKTSAKFFDFNMLLEEEKQKIKSLDDLISYLGNGRCSSIIVLESIPFNFITWSRNYNSHTIYGSEKNLKKLHENFPLLKHISLSNPNYTTFTPIKFHIELAYDWIKYDIDFSQLYDLFEISLNNCTGIKKFNDLAKLQNLRELDISHCTQITDFTFLNHIPKLAELNISHCTQITDFTFLNHIPNLFRLYCRGHMVSEDILRGLLNKKVEVICDMDYDLMMEKYLEPPEKDEICLIQ